jgi:hypothetical protein
MSIKCEKNPITLEEEKRLLLRQSQRQAAQSQWLGLIGNGFSRQKVLKKRGNKTREEVDTGSEGGEMGGGPSEICLVT